MINIPDSILEQIFIYLNWNERSRAARVCKKWYNVFQSPVLWRKIVFKPPCRRLTKLQYDIKGYRLSWWVILNFLEKDINVVYRIKYLFVITLFSDLTFPYFNDRMSDLYFLPGSVV